MSSSKNLSVKYYHIFQKFKFVYLLLEYFSLTIILDNPYIVLFRRNNTFELVGLHIT